MTEVIKPEMPVYQRQVLVCVGSRCTEHGEGQALYDELKARLKALGLDKGASCIKKTRAACLGPCKSGPLLCVQPDGIWYYDINSQKLERIIQEHLVGGQPIMEWVFHQGPGTIPAK